MNRGNVQVMDSFKRWFSFSGVIAVVLVSSGCLGGSDSDSDSDSDSSSSSGSSLVCRGSGEEYDSCLDYVGSQYTQVAVEAMCLSPMTFSTESCEDTQNSLSRVGYCQYFAGTPTEVHHVYYSTAGGTVGQILCTAEAGGVWIDETL